MAVAAREEPVGLMGIALSADQTSRRATIQDTLALWSPPGATTRRPGADSDVRRGTLKRKVNRRKFEEVLPRRRRASMAAHVGHLVAAVGIGVPRAG
jgi:hypothetical protein